MRGTLTLADGTAITGTVFGAAEPVAGELVFNTGMVGYPECLTDPSYRGQILVLTYPLIGNYGVSAELAAAIRNADGTGNAPATLSNTSRLGRWFESERVQIAGLIVAEACAEPSHYTATRSLSEWLRAEGVPGLSGVDTRTLTQRLREQGSLLAKITFDGKDVAFRDPNSENLVEQVSIDKRREFPGSQQSPRVAVIDCGCKRNIVRSLLDRGVSVTVVPWDCPIEPGEFDGVVVSNGPGDPKQCSATIDTLRRLLEGDRPVLGICLGNQLLARAAGAETYKLKYGHRSQNQPCVQVGTNRCFITSQNHGYAVDDETLSGGWLPWFFNANDGTNEGIRHRTKPFRSVQFHPEARPGPVDTAFLFDEFTAMLV